MGGDVYKRQEKYQIVYDGQKTYAFAMSNKYILGLFTHCEAARKSAVEDGRCV